MIKRRKTGNSTVCPLTGNKLFEWELFDDKDEENVVGIAYPSYKTRTQRVFRAEMTLNGVTASTENARSIGDAVKQMQATIDAGQPVVSTVVSTPADGATEAATA